MEVREFLDGLTWDPGEFGVRTTAEEGDWDAIVRFPSPRPSGEERNDEVVLEWYAARDGERQITMAPAMLVMHILDGQFAWLGGSRGSCNSAACTPS